MEDKIEQKVCNLCLNKINIGKKRQAAKEYLKIHATKIKLFSSKSYSEVSVGITVHTIEHHFEK